jgi:hypothetical protein
MILSSAILFLNDPALKMKSKGGQKTQLTLTLMHTCSLVCSGGVRGDISCFITADKTES